jgi:hypothetical protein
MIRIRVEFAWTAVRELHLANTVGSE